MQSQITTTTTTTHSIQHNQDDSDANLNDTVLNEIQRLAPLEIPSQCILELSNSLLSRINRRMGQHSRVDELSLEKAFDRELVSLLIQRGYRAIHHMAYYLLAFGLELSMPDKYHFEYDPQARIQCPQCFKSYKHSKSFSNHLDRCIDLEKTPWYVQVALDRATWASWSF